MDRLSSYAKRPIAFLLRYVRRRPLSHAAILAAVIGAVACSVSSQYGVKFLVDVLSGNAADSAIWLAFALAGVADRRRQPSVAAGRLDHQLCLRRRDRRPARRALPASHRTRAELFRRALGGNPDGPHHGDVECRIRGRESFHLERAAALPGDAVRHRLSRRRQRAHGGGPHGDRGRRHAAAVQAGGARRALASRLRQSRGQGRRRAGRRDRQHAAGAHLRRHPSRAQPVRPHGRPRDDRAAPQPAVSGAAAPAARRADHRADGGGARLGDRAVAARPGERRRRRAGLHAGLHRAACHARPRGGAGRRHPAHGAPGRGDRHPAAGARAARAPQGGAAGAAARGYVPGGVRERRLQPIPAAARCSRTSPRHRRRPTHRPGRSLGQRQVDGARPAAAFPRRRSRAHPDRRPGHRPHHPGEPAPRHLLRAAGHLACCTARSWRTSATAGPRPPTPRSRRRPRRRAAGFHRGAARRLLPPSSATAARDCRAASVSASPSPARS